MESSVLFTTLHVIWQYPQISTAVFRLIIAGVYPDLSCQCTNMAFHGRISENH